MTPSLISNVQEPTVWKTQGKVAFVQSTLSSLKHGCHKKITIEKQQTNKINSMENGIECMQVSGTAYLFLLLKLLSSSSVKQSAYWLQKNQSLRIDFNDPTEFSSLRQLSERSAQVTERKVFSNRSALFESTGCLVLEGGGRPAEKSVLGIWQCLLANNYRSGEWDSVKRSGMLLAFMSKLLFYCLGNRGKTLNLNSFLQAIGLVIPHHSLFYWMVQVKTLFRLSVFPTAFLPYNTPPCFLLLLLFMSFSWASGGSIVLGMRNSDAALDSWTHTV